MYNQPEFYSMIKDITLFFGGFILITSIFLFYPYGYKFRKKEVDFSVYKKKFKRNLKICNYCSYLAIAILVPILMHIKEMSKINMLEPEIFLLLSSVLMFFVLSSGIIEFFVSANRFSSFIGVKVPVLESEIGRIIKKNNTTLLYFYRQSLNLEDRIKTDIETTSASSLSRLYKPSSLVYPSCYFNKRQERFNKSIEKIERKIKILKLDLKENNSIFKKFEIFNENFLNGLISWPSSDHIRSFELVDTIPSIVIISEGYVKEYWVGYHECRKGLANFDIKNIGNIKHAIVLKSKINLFIGMISVFVLIEFLLAVSYFYVISQM